MGYLPVCGLVAHLCPFFLTAVGWLGWWVVGELKSNASTAFNEVVVEVEAELDNNGNYVVA